MLCSKCGYNNPLNIKFCKNCEVDLQPEPLHAAYLSDPPQLEYASYPIRLLATFLDCLLIVATLLLALFAAGLLIVITGSDDILHNEQAATIFYWITAACSVAYFILMDAGANGATLGKRWLNIKLTCADKTALSISRASVRFLALFLNILLFPFSLPVQLFNKRKQGLHDLLTGTVVVRANNNKKISVMATLLVLFMTLMLPLLLFMATAGLPYVQHYMQKVQLNKGIQSGHKAALAVARYYRINGRVPLAIEDADDNFIRSRQISTIGINQQNGEITLTFSQAAYRDIQGKHLVFKPALAADQNISWKCSSVDIETRFLPDTCL
jgi:uncharacterized RDD family membrane protein YckC